MQTLSLTFFDRQPLGQLLSRVSNDTEAVALFYEQAVAQIIRAIAQISLIVIVMLIVDWRLAIAALLIVPVMLILTSIIQRASTPAFAKMQETMGDLSGFQEETISGHKVIISNRRQDWATQANEQLAGGVFDVGSKAYFTSLLQMPLTSALGRTANRHRVDRRCISGHRRPDNPRCGDFVYRICCTAFRPLSEIANLTSTTLTAVAGGRRVFAIMDEQPTIVDAPDANDYEYTGGRIEFKDVDFSYVPGRKILKHNTFVAEPGQKIGICGPTGAGKSTIMNILTRYYDIDSGTILIDGQNLEALTQVSLREQVGMVLQEAFLFSDTVMNNLRSMHATAQLTKNVSRRRNKMRTNSLSTCLKGTLMMMIERGSNLSQGQRQMITIARAMVANPKIMILDEAIVDTRTEKLIQEGLNRLMEGRTSFCRRTPPEHDSDSHKIMVLNGGEIVEMDSHDNLMAAKGFTYALYMSQFKGHSPESDQRSATTDWIST